MHTHFNRNIFDPVEHERQGCLWSSVRRGVPLLAVQPPDSRLQSEVAMFLIAHADWGDSEDSTMAPSD